jgi:hypothetical protein
MVGRSDMESMDKNPGSCEGTPAPSDVLGYDTEKGAEQIDVMGYQAGGPKNETDAMDYDTEKGAEQPDVMGYKPGGPKNETDAMAYDRPEGTPDNDAFMKPEKC